MPLAGTRSGKPSESYARVCSETDGAEVKIDYFATSLPNLLLFEDDLQKRNQVDCLFLLALSELGLRNHERAMELLNQVLSLDCNHMAAQQELESLTRIPATTTAQQ